ncbi:MAG: sulfur carrier protein ThiS [Alphaproteobacteria bacterium]|jgi:thiamine biosynthesis protein ThiS|nr:sulfur carrier protein ThiS [Alphaproteobacteria bacterium]
MLNLVLNGEPRAFAAPLDVAGLIAHLELDARKVAVERNLAIVPRSAYADTHLLEGDRIEIVTFVGGG